MTTVLFLEPSLQSQINFLTFDLFMVLISLAIAVIALAVALDGKADKPKEPKP